MARLDFRRYFDAGDFDFALMARPPIIHVSFVAVIGLILAMSILLFACGLELWKITKFG